MIFTKLFLKRDKSFAILSAMSRACASRDLKQLFHFVKLGYLLTFCFLCQNFVLFSTYVPINLENIFCLQISLKIRKWNVLTVLQIYLKIQIFRLKVEIPFNLVKLEHQDYGEHCKYRFDSSGKHLILLHHPWKNRTNKQKLEHLKLILNSIAIHILVVLIDITNSRLP